VPLNGDDTEAGCIKIPRSFLSSLGISKNDANPMYSLRERFFELKNANKEMQEKLQAFDYDRVYQLEYSLESSRMDLSLSEEQGRAYISRISELEEEVSVLRASSNSPSPQSENLAEKLRAQLTEQSRKRALENTQKELVESKKTVEELSQQVTMLQFQLAIHRAAGFAIFVCITIVNANKL
jgi:primosomal protein N''